MVLRTLPRRLLSVSGLKLSCFIEYLIPYIFVIVFSSSLIIILLIMARSIFTPTNISLHIGPILPQLDSILLKLS